MASTNITTFPGKVGISNTNPTHTLSIGSNVFVDDTGLIVTGSITTTGELSGDGAGLSNIQTSNVIGLTNNVARIGTLETDLDSNVTRIETLETDLDSNATRIGTLETDLDSNVTRIETLETDLDSNVTRIGNLESGDITITGTKTFQDDVVLESNLRVQGDLLVANTVNMTVSDPILELGSNNLNTGDVGLVMTRHGDSNSNVAIFFDETADILKLGYTLNGANDTTLEFDSNALAVSVQGALYGEIAGSNTITASTIYGEIAGSNAITASTGTFSGDFEVGTANLFVDTTTSNVGVGTNTPAYKLDVHGTANVGTLNATLMYSNASANIVAWNTSTNEVIDSGLERGFTEHPVEAMTDYKTYVEGHGTYEASASSEYVSGSDQRLAWKAMNLQTGDYTNSWRGIGVYNTSSPYVYDTAAAYNISNPKFITDVGGTRYNGDYIILKVPRSILLSHTVMYETTSESTRAPTGGTILGSSDGKNWFKLTTFSSISYTNGQSTVSVNATTPYTYFALVVTNIGGSTVVSLSEWRLFAEKPVTRMENVHISGELSSETLQTGYIKWPKVPLKAAESEGYVVSASENSPYLQGILKPWKAFNNIIGQLSGWSTFGTRYNSDGTLITSTSFQGYDGHWLKISMPQSIVPSFMLFYPYVDGRQFMRAGKILASNDEITWDAISSFSDVIRGEFDFEPHRINISAHKSYSSFAVVVSENNGLGWLAIDEWEIYESTLGVGTSATTAKLTVDGGLGLAKGSQVFARSEVVMELPKHDRPLVKYPEVAMTGASTAGYVASASSARNDGTQPYKAFENVDTQDWSSSAGKYDTSGNATSSDSFLGINGSYIKLSLPVSIKVKQMVIKRDDDSRPTDIKLYGYKSGSWTEIFNDTGITYDSNQLYTAVITNE